MFDPVEAFLFDGNDELAINDKGRRSVPVVSVDSEYGGHGGEESRGSRVESRGSRVQRGAHAPRPVPMPCCSLLADPEEPGLPAFFNGIKFMMITSHHGGTVFSSERQRHCVGHGDAEPGFESGG